MKVTDLFGRKLPVIGLDFETYYEQGKGAEYTLSKMTTTTYVRSPRFIAHGASIREGDEPARWISGSDLAEEFEKIDWPNVALLCHNTAFDGLILSQHYGYVPGYYLDTLSMSRGEWGVHYPHALSAVGQRLELGGKIEGSLVKTANLTELPPEVEQELAIYANRDVDLMWDIFNKLYYDHSYPDRELHIIDLTVRAFCDPVLQINRPLCAEEAAEEVRNKSSLIAGCRVDASVLASNPQFAELLRERGVEPPTKISPLTGESTYAFAKADLAFQELEKDPRVADIVRARKAVKSTIGETRAYRFIAHSDPTLPVLLHYCGAHTHRWTAGDKINLQNLPADRKGQSTRLRRAIEAPFGHVLVVVDSSQIEARTNAWAAGQTDLLQVFREKGDPYSLMAAEIYGYPIDKKKHPAERQVGKTAVLGCGYGMGAAKFAATVRSGASGPPIDISDDLAERAVRVYRQKNAYIVRLWNELQTALTRMLHEQTFEVGPWMFHGNQVAMPNGLFIRYPKLTADETENGFDNFRYYSRGGWTYLYGGKLCENLIQSTARTVVAFQALEIAKRYRIVNLVHDEVIYLAKEEEADDALQYGIACLSQPPSFCPDLPVTAEGGYARNYSK